MILGTSAVIDFFRGDPYVREKLRQLEEKGVVFSTTAITIVELFRGINVENTKEVKELDDYLETIDLFELDIWSAREAGIISASLRESGLSIEPEDCMIAGISKTKNEPILTRNVKHFERITGVKIETY